MIETTLVHAIRPGQIEPSVHRQREGAVDNKQESRKPVWACANHERALAGTGFQKCAPCPGCGGKIMEGLMRCGRVGGNGVLITEAQARRCDGTKPPPYNKKSSKRNTAEEHHTIPTSAFAV